MDLAVMILIIHHVQHDRTNVELTGQLRALTGKTTDSRRSGVPAARRQAALPQERLLSLAGRASWLSLAARRPRDELA
jgi:hypothetical protein